MYIIYMQYPSLFPIAQKQKGSTPESNTIELFDDAWTTFFSPVEVSSNSLFFPMEVTDGLLRDDFSGQPHINRCEKKTYGCFQK